MAGRSRAVNAWWISLALHRAGEHLLLPLPRPASPIFTSCRRRMAAWCAPRRNTPRCSALSTNPARRRFLQQHGSSGARRDRCAGEKLITVLMLGAALARRSAGAGRRSRPQARPRPPAREVLLLPRAGAGNVAPSAMSVPPPPGSLPALFAPPGVSPTMTSYGEIMITTSSSGSAERSCSAKSSITPAVTDRRATGC